MITRTRLYSQDTSNAINGSTALAMKSIKTLEDLKEFGGRIVAFTIAKNCKEEMKSRFDSNHPCNQNVKLEGSNMTGFAYLPTEANWTNWNSKSRERGPRLFRIITNGGGSATPITASEIPADLEMRFASAAEKQELAEIIREKKGGNPNISFSQLLLPNQGEMTEEEQASFILAH